jgi:hypothetical protein
MTDLDTILRYGASAEVAAVYDAVRELCECPSPSKRHEYLERLERAYEACEAAHADFERRTAEYMDEPDEPAEIRHKWTPG